MVTFSPQTRGKEWQCSCPRRSALPASCPHVWLFYVCGVFFVCFIFCFFFSSSLCCMVSKGILLSEG